MTNPVPPDLDLTVSNTVFGVPRSHWGCTLMNFRWPSNAVKTAVMGFMANLLTGTKANLLLTGPPGVGKSHLAISLYRWGVLHWGTIQCSLVMVPEFFHLVKQQFDKPTSEDPLRDIGEARKLVVLDDILGRVPTPWELNHIIFRLINTAYVNGAPMIITTNYPLKELGQFLHPHELSRVLNNVTHIEMKGDDQRLPSQ